VWICGQIGWIYFPTFEKAFIPMLFTCC